MNINLERSLPERPKKNMVWPVIMLIISISALNYSCKKSPGDDELVLDKNLTKSAKKYQALVAGRDGQKGNFDITNVERTGDILTVTTRGGCSADDFSVVWNGEILLSYPAQVKLVIYKNSSTTCAPGTVVNVKIDLTKIMTDPNGKDFIFHVANGSIKEDKSLNPDGSISSY